MYKILISILAFICIIELLYIFYVINMLKSLNGFVRKILDESYMKDMEVLRLKKEANQKDLKIKDLKLNIEVLKGNTNDQWWTKKTFKQSIYNDWYV